MVNIAASAACTIARVFGANAPGREGDCRISNGDRVHRMAALAMCLKPSADYSGYWQRHFKQ
jgi:hypothetical protein